MGSNSELTPSETVETFEDDESEVGVGTLEVAKCVFDVVLRFLMCKKSYFCSSILCNVFVSVYACS